MSFCFLFFLLEDKSLLQENKGKFVGLGQFICPLRHEFCTGLLRSARNDVSGEGGKLEAVVALLPTKVVIASRAERSNPVQQFMPEGHVDFF
jgi:hypothetical protein